MEALNQRIIKSFQRKSYKKLSEKKLLKAFREKVIKIFLAVKCG